MNEFKVGDDVWYFYYNSMKGYIYPRWMHLLHGKVVWIKPDEEIIHVYVDGQETISVLLELVDCVFHSKKAAINSMLLRLQGLEND